MLHNKNESNTNFDTIGYLKKSVTLALCFNLLCHEFVIKNWYLFSNFIQNSSVLTKCFINKIQWLSIFQCSIVTENRAQSINTRRRMSRFLTFLIALQMYLVKLTNSLTDFCYRCCKNCRLVIAFFLGHSKHEYLAQAYQNSLRKNKQ